MGFQRKENVRYGKFQVEGRGREEQGVLRRRKEEKLGVLRERNK